MQKTSKILFLILPIFFNNTIVGMKSSPYIITFFLKPQTALPTTDATTSSIKNPVRKTIEAIMTTGHNTKPVSGIYATYNGYATVSDINGQVMFPRKVVEPTLHLLITEEIEPLLTKPLQQNLIEGFVLEPHVPHKFYLLERRENPETKQPEWIAQEKTISKSKKIPYNTITLFANPKNVFIPTANKTIELQGNLLLPDVYIKANTDFQLTALSFLKIRPYFSQIRKKYEFKQSLYQERIT